MLKIIQSIVLTLALIGTTSTQAGSNFKDIIDELDYSLNVEWDQVDPQFYNDQISHFESALINKGITKLDLLTYIQNEPIYADLSVGPIVDSLLLDPNISDAEAHALILQLMPKMYKKGASWVGGIDVLAWSWGIALVALTIGISAYFMNKKYGEVKPTDPTDQPSQKYGVSYAGTCHTNRGNYANGQAAPNYCTCQGGDHGSCTGCTSTICNGWRYK